MARCASMQAWQQPPQMGLMDDTLEAQQVGGFVSRVDRIGC